MEFQNQSIFKSQTGIQNPKSSDPGGQKGNIFPKNMAQVAR
jgi:hypothetical protein